MPSYYRYGLVFLLTSQVLTLFAWYFCYCSRRPVPTRRAVGAAPEPLSVDESSDDGSSSDDDSSAASLLEKSNSTSTCYVSFQVCYVMLCSLNFYHTFSIILLGRIRFLIKMLPFLNLEQKKGERKLHQQEN